MSLRALSLVATLAMVVHPALAKAQQLELTQPLKAASPLAVVREATPARLEWVYWAAGGIASTEGKQQSLGGGLGVELTSELLSYSGFPAGPYPLRRNRAELRGGAWAAGQTRSWGGLIEGGFMLDLGAAYHASWGTFDLRWGGGYGAFVEGRAPHVLVTLTYGVRSVPARYTRRGRGAPRSPPKAVALASVARIFVTRRQSLGDDMASELVVGLELSPTFFLPPYSWFKLLGGPPP